MNDHVSYLVLILLVATISQNRGEKINSLASKFNERRAAGILAQPRVGRTTGLSDVARSDGVTGLVHYPRVGRSGLFPPYGNFNQDSPFELGGTMKLLDPDDTESTSLINVAYQKYPRGNVDEQSQFQPKQFGILAKNRRWVDRSRYEGVRGCSHPQLRLCTDCTIGGIRALLFTPSKETARLKGPWVYNYITRPTREIDQAQRDTVS